MFIDDFLYNNGGKSRENAAINIEIIMFTLSLVGTVDAVLLNCSAFMAAKSTMNARFITVYAGVDRAILIQVFIERTISSSDVLVLWSYIHVLRINKLYIAI